MSIFTITYSWYPRSQPRPFAAEDYVDASRVFLALRRFLATVQGEFVIQVENCTLLFAFDPDLSTIFEEMPAVLDHLRMDTAAPVELAFYEQGTDLTWWVERHGATITLRFSKGEYSGKRFHDLPSSPFAIPAEVFMEEWRRFLLSVLDALVVLDTDLERDDNYRAYRTCLLSVSPVKNPPELRATTGL
jgi:hypothetical protein